MQRRLPDTPLIYALYTVQCTVVNRSSPKSRETILLKQKHLVLLQAGTMHTSVVDPDPYWIRDFVFRSFVDPDPHMKK